MAPLLSLEESPWDLYTSTGHKTDGLLTLLAGNNITLNNGSQITDANNWGVSLEAGYDFGSHSVKDAGSGSITLNGERLGFKRPLETSVWSPAG